jgi:hypothetical protein
METFDEPFELAGDILGINVLGYSVLQIGVGLGVIGLGMYALRKGYEKVFNG